MAARLGVIHSSDQTVGVRQDMDDAILILSPHDAPLQQRLPSRPTDEVKVEWLEEDLMAQSDTVSAVSGSGPWTVDVSDTNLFRENDILWKQDAAATVQYLVDSITDSNTMVISGFAGNSTAPSNSDVLTIVGQYRVEGDDPDEARSAERSTKFNYTQVIQEAVEVTRTARKRGLYGLDDPYQHELMKKLRELAIRRERALVVGQRSISGSGTQRTSGGLLYYITTNSASGVKANAQAVINEALKECYEAGGTPRTIWCSPSMKQAISDNLGASLRRTTREDRGAGSVVDSFISDFGEVEFEVDRFLPKTKALVLQHEFDIVRVFDGIFHELLAKTGDRMHGEVVEEKSLEVKNEVAQAVITLTDV